MRGIQHIAIASYWQEAYHAGSTDGKSNHNLILALRFSGAFDRLALEVALSRLLARHEALRTTLVRRAEVVHRYVWQDLDLDLATVDLSGVAEHALRLQATLVRLADHPFEIDGGQLATATLIRLAGDRNVVALVLHHAIADAWSCEVVRQDLLALYFAEATQRDSSLVPLASQFRHFAATERAYGDAAVLEGWRRRLHRSGVVDESLVSQPFDGVGQHTIDIRRCCEAPPDVMAGIRALAMHHRTVTSAVLIAAASTSFRVRGLELNTVGLVHANRYDRRSWPVVGMFADILPVSLGRTRPEDLKSALPRARAAVLEAFQNRAPGGAIAHAAGLDLMHHVGINYIPRQVKGGIAGLREADTSGADVRVRLIEVPFESRNVRVGRLKIPPVSFILSENDNGGLSIALETHSGAMADGDLLAMATGFRDTLAVAAASAPRALLVVPPREMSRADGPEA